MNGTVLCTLPLKSNRCDADASTEITFPVTCAEIPNKRPLTIASLWIAFLRAKATSLAVAATATLTGIAFATVTALLSCLNWKVTTLNRLSLIEINLFCKSAVEARAVSRTGPLFPRLKVGTLERSILESLSSASAALLGIPFESPSA